jgi:oligopeptide/dipeptide ABC transporter ATP-binding protein
MAIIPQKQLFKWDEIEELGDLERLKLVLDHMPDEELMAALEKHRGKGRNDYPVRAIWNSIIAGVVFQHDSTESLRRELMRNGQLRQVCGFDIMLGVKGVPSSPAYTRFLKNLMKHQREVNKMFDNLVKMLCEELPDLGEVLAIDGKAIESYARRRRDEDERSYDGRRDIDADIGVKEYKGKNKDGSVWKKVKTWFGYKLHLIVDAKYELPVAFSVTKASRSEAQVEEMLSLVGLAPPSAFLFRFPHELSGGQRQRVAIARALVVRPSFVVADEPTSMLDVSIRTGIMKLMAQLREDLGISYLYITHDLAVARYLCDRIAVMYLGKIVELGNSEDIVKRPLHPYTKALISAVPVPDPAIDRPLPNIKGGVSKPIDPKPRCRFYDRCPESADSCAEAENPELRDIGGGHLVACHLL